jgi:hypothetical protein
MNDLLDLLKCQLWIIFEVFRGQWSKFYQAGFFLRQTLKPHFRQYFQRSQSPEPNYSKVFRKTEQQ